MPHRVNEQFLYVGPQARVRSAAHRRRHRGPDRFVAGAAWRPDGRCYAASALGS
jgi:hypothetical protein